ncbi:MAG: hypothetical protein ABIH41_06605, partial [Nanoarchaeota archaeon]
MYYLAHLIPPPDLVERMVAYQETYRDRNIIPSKAGIHCTIFAAHIKEGLDATLITGLRRLHHPPVTVELLDLERFHSNSLAQIVRPTQELKNIHTQVGELFLPLIDKPRMRPIPKEYAHEQERQRAHEAYGSCFFGPFFRPHITIGQINFDGFTIP